jgi:hypothetical protein
MAWWWKDFSRPEVLAAIEEASGKALNANDPLPDMLIAGAQQSGLSPSELRLWIYDDVHRADWNIDALARWARHYGLGAYSAAAAEAGAADRPGQ